MSSWSGFLDTIVLLGILQGFILSALLFSSRRKKPANRFLAALIMLITLACLNIYLLDATWLDSNIVLHILAGALPLVVIMPIGPLIWCYVQATTDPAFRLTRKRYRHFYSIVLDLFPYVLILLADIGSLTGLVSKGQRSWVSDFIDQWQVYADIPRWLSLTAYLWLTRHYLQQQRAAQAAGQQQTTGWLRQFVTVFLVFQAIWFVYLVPYSIPATRQALLDAVDWYPVFIPLAVMIYWLGLKGYLVHYNPFELNSSKTLATVSALPETLATLYIDQLQLIMETQKLYLDPSLTVNTLAKQVDIPAKTVSAVLNQHLHKSFSVFVNEYRIAAFRERIMQGDAGNLTIPGLAAECGFSSAATFQRIFKQLTGITPSQFIQESKLPEGDSARTLKAARPADTSLKSGIE
ncbi:MAG: helix-turn-helix domain-containing protein [Niastella sp.]|nr:helix-turn-helix domain-containing protein [Niastella sp.]